MSVKLRKRPLRAGSVSLYLDICQNGQRWKEYLGIKLEVPTDSKVQELNELKMQTAMRLCAERERQLRQNRCSVNQYSQTSVGILTVFEQFIASYRRKDIKVVMAAFSHLKKFVREKDLPLACLDKVFCEDFLFYLSERLHGSTPVGYFKKFKMCLAQCVEKGLLLKNPAAGIRLISSEEITKDILSCEEIQKLADTPLEYSEVKRAFLFACYTGLRWCDIVALKYRSVDFQRNMLVIRQLKVMRYSSRAVLHLNLSMTAVHLLRKKSGEADDLVFQLPSYPYVRRLLMKWSEKAGIRKHITFHCARHSFITNIMLQGANIKTAAILAGHSTIRHTEKYVHIIDEVKQLAVDSLPELDLDDME